MSYSPIYHIPKVQPCALLTFLEDGCPVHLDNGALVLVLFVVGHGCATAMTSCTESVAGKFTAAQRSNAVNDSPLLHVGRLELLENTRSASQLLVFVSLRHSRAGRSLGASSPALNLYHRPPPHRPAPPLPASTSFEHSPNRQFRTTKRLEYHRNKLTTANMVRGLTWSLE